MNTKLHLAVAVAALSLAGALFWEWRGARLDRGRLQTQLAQAEQALQQATSNQQQRDKQLTDTLAKLDDLKATVKTQQQILARLPDVLPLPKPIQESPHQLVQAPGGTSSAKPGIPESPMPQSATIPLEDLKPLYDFAVDCKACQVKLATATADLSDERVKTQTLSRERDAALKLVHGGSLRQRLKRGFKWFVIGVVVGTIAAKTH